MKNNKFWKILSVLLLACNIVLLVLLMKRPAPMEGHHPPHPPKIDSFIIEELNLDANQQKKFLALKKEHRQKIESLLKQGKTLRNDYFGELKSGNGNDSLIAIKSEAIAKNQQEIEIATFNHFKSLREICSDIQKDSFDKIILEILKRMAPPPPPPPPGAPNAPGGPPPPPPPPPPAD